MQKYKDDYTREDLDQCYAAILTGWIKKFSCETIWNEESYQVERLTIEAEDYWDEGPENFVKWLRGLNDANTK